MRSIVLDEVSTNIKEQVLKLEALDALRDFIGSEPLQHYLADFIGNTAKNIQRIGTAIATRDDRGIRHLAHKLKGSSGNIGALKLAWHCMLLEAASADAHPHEELMSQYRQLECVYRNTQTAIQLYIDELAAARASIA